MYKVQDAFALASRYQLVLLLLGDSWDMIDDDILHSVFVSTFPIHCRITSLNLAVDSEGQHR